jgi:hypothetical protein
LGLTREFGWIPVGFACIYLILWILYLSSAIPALSGDEGLASGGKRRYAVGVRLRMEENSMVGIVK